VTLPTTVMLVLVWRESCVDSFGLFVRKQSISINECIMHKGVNKQVDNKNGTSPEVLHMSQGKHRHYH